MNPSDDKHSRSGDGRRRGVVRTALILAGVVFLIYLFFVGRAALTYFGS
jgi:hypothetical protein